RTGRGRNWWMASGLYLCRFGNGFWKGEYRVKTGASPELSKTIVLIKPTPAQTPPFPLILITIFRISAAVGCAVATFNFPSSPEKYPKRHR
ncbi:MAG: hypothetical protein K8R17_03260, partial [Methanosarcinales archaeon]|nr:hypothetical protein [Methanosarcinales archaeon]